MLPYIHVDRFTIGSFSLPSFLTLVVLGCILACVVTVWRGRLTGIPVERTELLCLLAVIGSYLGATLGSWIYKPGGVAQLLADPSLFQSAGLSSFGGFAGGLLTLAGFLWIRRIRGEERWRYVDAIIFSLPFGGMLGRLGCTLVHDHPGIANRGWLAVRYPDIPRYDLGLLEFLFLAVLGGVFLFLARRARVPGFYFVVFFLSYGLFRLTIDPLHIDPIRYAGFTVDQYAATVLILLAVVRAYNRRWEALW